MQEQLQHHNEAILDHYLAEHAHHASSQQQQHQQQQQQQQQVPSLH